MSRIPVVLVMALFFSAGVSAQPPGGRGGPDADAIWGFMTNGNPNAESIDLNQRPDLRDRMLQRGQTLPPNGILTKAQFKADFEKRRAEGKGGRPRGPGGNSPGSNGPGGPPVAAPPAPDPSQSPPQPVPYQPPVPDAPGGGRSKPKDDEPDVRASVSRFGKLPKEVPSWFEEYDTDQDGMVGLYEWRRQGKTIAEFVKMDLNGDGYLTADEWIRYKKYGIDKMDKDDDKPTRTAAADSADKKPDSAAKDASGKADAGKRARGQKGPASGGKKNTFTDK